MAYGAYIIQSVRNRPKLIFKSYDKPRSLAEMKNEIDFSIPGVDKIFNSKLPIYIRIAWSVLLFVCMVICIYQIQDRVCYFLQSPVSIAYEMKENGTFYFPPLTICSTILSETIAVAMTKMAQLDKSCSFEDLKLCNWNLLEQLNWDLSYDNFTLPADRITVIRSMSGDEDNTHSPETVTPIRRTNINTMYGSCPFFYEATKILYHGSRTQLKFIITNNPMEEWAKKINNSVLTYYFFLSNNDDMAIYDSTNAIALNSGNPTIVKLHMKSYSFLNRKDSPCSDSYTTSCGVPCLNQSIQRFFNCSLPFMESPGKKKCSNLPDMVLSGLKIRQLGNWILHQCRCPKKCNQIHYVITEMASHSPMSVYNLTKDETVIMFVYSQNMYEFIKEIWDYPFASLLGDIGGNLGLFLGICIPSVMEIIHNIVLYWRGSKKQIHSASERQEVN